MEKDNAWNSKKYSEDRAPTIKEIQKVIEISK